MNIERRHFGFTLIELMMMLLVIAILSSIGGPIFSDLIQRNRQNSMLNHFLSTLHVVRSEAIKRSRLVVACPSSDASACNAALEWTEGWIVFVDVDADGVRDSAPGSGEVLIQAQPALEDGYSLVGDAGVDDFIRYGADGVSLENGTFTLCDPRGASAARAIVVSVTGRPRASESDLSGGTLSC